MYRITLIFSAFLTAINVYPQMDLPGHGGNIRATISEEVGITSITIKYSRPGVKGREGKIWGNVVAYDFGNFNFYIMKGTSPWRAGANEATNISFEHDVKVEGKNLKAGTYALFIAMGKDSATLIFSKQAEAWGSFYYKQEDDVLRIKVKTETLDKSIERMKFEFLDYTENSCVIAMQWERVSVPFKVEVDLYNIIIARLREQVIGPKGFLNANLIHASSYCFDHNINMEEALRWAERAVTGEPFSQTGFEAYTNLATGYEKLGQLIKADSVMNIGLSIATIDEYTSYGRKLISQNRNKKALEIMLDAQKKFGDVYDINNSLSYGYSAAGDFKNALLYANKALLQAATERSRTNINNNIKMLKERIDINK